jgi:hypothetical protein
VPALQALKDQLPSVLSPVGFRCVLDKERFPSTSPEVDLNKGGRGDPFSAKVFHWLKEKFSDQSERMGAGSAGSTGEQQASTAAKRLHVALWERRSSSALIVWNAVIFS